MMIYTAQALCSDHGAEIFARKRMVGGRVALTLDPLHFQGGPFASKEGTGGNK
jgi:hypothetical protein